MEAKKTKSEIHPLMLNEIIRRYYLEGVHQLGVIRYWLDNYYIETPLRPVIMAAVRTTAKQEMKKVGEMGRVLHSDILDFFFENDHLRPEDMLAAAIIAGDAKDVEKWIGSFNKMVTKYSPSELEPGLSGALDEKRLKVLVKGFRKRMDEKYRSRSGPFMSMVGEARAMIDVRTERRSNAVGRLLARHRGLVEDAAVHKIIKIYNDEIWNAAT